MFTSLKRAATLLALVLLTSQASARTVLRYTDHEPLGGMRTRFLKDVLFAAIERESEGRIRIEDHWNGEVADSHGVLAAVAKDDKADIGIIVPEYFAKEMPVGQLFKSYLVGPTGADHVEFFRRAFAEIPAFGEELRRNGLTGIFYATGYPVAFYSINPLRGLADIRDRTWRTASFWHRDFLRNAGARPVSIPWGPGVFDAMRTKNLDGLMVNADSGYLLNVHKVAPYVLAARDLWLGHVYIVAMNSRAWERLSEADKAAIQRATASAYQRLGPVMDRSFDAMVRTLEGEGATVRLLSRGEIVAFARATRYRDVQAAWARGEKSVDNRLATQVLGSLDTLIGKVE